MVWSWRTCYYWTGASTHARSERKKQWQRLNSAYSVCFSESTLTSYSSYLENRSFQLIMFFWEKFLPSGYFNQKFIPCDFLFQKKKFVPSLFHSSIAKNYTLPKAHFTTNVWAHWKPSANLPWRLIFCDSCGKQVGYSSYNNYHILYLSRKLASKLSHGSSLTIEICSIGSDTLFVHIAYFRP